MTPGFLGRIRGRPGWLAVGLVLLASARIVATHRVFSQTYDEPAHVAAGMEWLDKGRYTYELLHPPLARVASAVLPYADGIRSMGNVDIWKEGNDLLYARGTYGRNLALARLGILPFFVLAAGVVWMWTTALFGGRAALVAVAMFTTLPPVLAHAGLATTDMAAAATVALALFALVRWLEAPTGARSTVLGIAMALAALSKVSGPVFLVASVVPLLVVRWAMTFRQRVPVAGEPTPRVARRVGSLGVAAAAAVLVVWAGYRFSTGPLFTSSDGFHVRILDRVTGGNETIRDAVIAATHAPVYPAPEFVRGLSSVAWMNQAGRASYVLGSSHHGGVWYFFPVALAVKTPVPFLILAVMGAVAVLRRRRWQDLAPVLGAGAIMAVVIPMNINLGLRHVLPIYPLLAVIVGAAAAVEGSVRRRRIQAGLLLLLVAWQVISSIRAHPDYLAWFNELARLRAEPVLLDSDLDWGQDLNRLADTLRARRIPAVAIGYWGTADPERHGLPPVRRLAPGVPTTGWIAVSRYPLLSGTDYQWLRDRQPAALIGTSMLLFHVSDTAASR